MLSIRLTSSSRLGSCTPRISERHSPFPFPSKEGQLTVEMPDWEQGQGARLPTLGHRLTRKSRPVRPKVVNLALADLTGAGEGKPRGGRPGRRWPFRGRALRTRRREVGRAGRQASAHRC
jgi:hypothetical protein